MVRNPERESRGGGPVAAVAGLALGLLMAPSSATGTGCPAAQELESRLRQLGPERGTVATEMGVRPPWELYRRAARDVGRIVVDRDGQQGHAVMVAERSAETLWQVISDEPHFGEEAFPVDVSRVVQGEPGDVERVVFQAVKRFGIGRWWVSTLHANRELFAGSGGRLWELTWRDALETWDRSTLPLAELDSDIVPIRWSRGAWLLADLGPRCTLVDYFSWSDAGGLVALASPFVLTRGLADTLRGVLAMAEGHIARPHPDIVFRRPDGTPIAPRAEPRRPTGE